MNSSTPSHITSYETESICMEYAYKDVQMTDSATNTKPTNTFAQKCSEKNTIMTSSIASALDDSTPSDSGVQLLDSVSSSGLNESIMSNSGFDFDMTSCTAPQEFHEISLSPTHTTTLPDLLLPANEPQNRSYIMMTKSDIDNSNINAATNANEIDVANIPDEMKTSTCSTFDSENIVYRRKNKISRPHSTSGPKKRVSFHEDILKNTKTDNIHIEHGFITYNGYSKKHPQIARYSWCSEGAVGAGADEEYTTNNQYYYRNACSDVLDYGKTDLYEKESRCIQYDNSGVFEYAPLANNGNNQPATNDNFYKCNCSSSNSSLNSGDSNDNVIKRNYGQAKSSSCDCIGVTQQLHQNISINGNCYFSEPNIELLDDTFEHIKPKSVWSKEKKPKSSCLKSKKYHNGVIVEYDISSKVKTFNVHHLPDMNNLIDNSKQIFGSLKNIFAMPLPERGVPEGCEDLQTVYECVPDIENDSPVHKPRPFLSKSFDGGLYKNSDKPKKYVHNVDEQLRHKHESKLEMTHTELGMSKPPTNEVELLDNSIPQPQQSPNNFRNKYIINCESTVFEHIGVSYENDTTSQLAASMEPTAISLPKSKPASSKPFPSIPFRQKLSNIIKSFRDSSSDFEATIKKEMGSLVVPPSPKLNPAAHPTTSPITDQISEQHKIPNEIPKSMESSILSDQSISSISHSTQDKFDYGGATVSSPSSNNKSRHLISPMRKKSLTTRFERSRMSPDLFGGRESKCTLSEEFDDILTITTTTDADPNDSDIVIVDYPDQHDSIVGNNLLKPPSTSSSKYSLINRFLRNVTQKKIQDATVKKNSFLAAKMKNEKKLFENIYVKGVRPRNPDLIEDLNAEIALEIELSGCTAGVTSNLRNVCSEQPKNEFTLGVGEIALDTFLLTKRLHIFRDNKETLMKVFKLYTGYSLEGYMTPVLVFLTDKTLYVTDLIRNRLFNKFVLPYSELDVILIGPHGNTVLLSNSVRDMQQVLLAGGPYPADGLVSSLEMCARRGGTVLPAIGQLTLDHLAPLQAFVRENSSVSKNDPWIYYAVVSVPASSLNHDAEPMGPHIKGPLMYRNTSSNIVTQHWEAGYFLLKAGVLYMFNDAHHKLPSLVIALHECKGARRAMISNRPHCFEILLKSDFMQLAAPDEYVASEWLQALVQAASGLFEMQERHKSLGCTLVMTSNHLITLREDFTAPLRRVNSENVISPKKHISEYHRKISTSTLTDTFHETISNVSSSTKLSDSRLSSAKSSPTRSDYYSPYRNSINVNNEKSFTSMSSIYGKNSGIEIKTCASLQEMSSIRVPTQADNWWCILEFTCQEVRENSDDMVIFFATNSDMRRFLTMLETLWQSKYDAPFPVSILKDDDLIGKHCSDLFLDINKSWDPLISAALGYPQ